MPCGPAVSWLQFEKQRAGFLDVSFGTTLGGRLEGNRRRMIRPADEIQGFPQAAHGFTVDLYFFHSGVSQASACFVASIGLIGSEGPKKWWALLDLNQ